MNTSVQETLQADTMNTVDIADITDVPEQKITHSDMVSVLFKKSGMFEEYSALMHAAIGISGEVAEIVEACRKSDEINLVEEFGDLEFYIVAARQSASIEEDRVVCAVETAVLNADNHRDLNESLVIVAGNILDIAKRCWVYGAELDTEREQKLVNNIALLMYYLDAMYNKRKYLVETILAANMDKLIGPTGRYKDQVYSDLAARERADKTQEQKELL